MDRGCDHIRQHGPRSGHPGDHSSRPQQLMVMVITRIMRRRGLVIRRIVTVTITDIIYIYTYEIYIYLSLYTYIYI